MDFSGPGVTYALLLIPTLFAVTVMVQGVVKLANGQKDGPVALGFGLLCLMLIAAAYWFFIR